MFWPWRTSELALRIVVVIEENVMRPGSSFITCPSQTKVRLSAGTSPSETDDQNLLAPGSYSDSSIMSNTSAWIRPGFFGPVTATLDWCEVSSFIVHRVLSSLSAVQLPVLLLHRRNGEQLLQSVYNRARCLRCGRRGASIASHQIYSRLRGTSLK